MLLSEIGDKEIVDISKGSMHGRLWDAEILFDEKTGKIHSLSVPDFSKFARKIQRRFAASVVIDYNSGRRHDNFQISLILPRKKE